jgi:protein TonB
LVDLYPQRALESGAGGTTTLHCLLEPDTRLHDCSVAEETPAGGGFGRAALDFATMLRIRPFKQGNEDVKHEKIELPITWSAPR